MKVSPGAALNPASLAHSRVSAFSSARPPRSTHCCSAPAGKSWEDKHELEDPELSMVSPVAARRQLLQLGISAALASPLTQGWAWAEESAVESAVTTTTTTSGNKVFLDVKLETQPLGRVTIELFDSPSIGSARFRDLAVGKQGVGYKLSRFDGIFPTYLRVEGVKSLSYSATGESPITGGASTQALEEELEAQTRTHDSAGLVSILVRDAKERPTTEKLIARDGKLVTITLQSGEAANGTQFMITRAPEPSLDKTNLIVGRVVGGQDVLDTIAAQPYARPRDSYYDQPFFSVAKAIGDKRADTAEKGFNRPLKRIVITKGGLA